MHLPNASYAVFGGNTAVGVQGSTGTTTAFNPTYQDYDGTRAIRIITSCHRGKCSFRLITRPVTSILSLPLIDLHSLTLTQFFGTTTLIPRLHSLTCQVRLFEYTLRLERMPCCP